LQDTFIETTFTISFSLFLLCFYLFGLASLPAAITVACLLVLLLAFVVSDLSLNGVFKNRNAIVSLSNIDGVNQHIPASRFKTNVKKLNKHQIDLIDINVI